MSMEAFLHPDLTTLMKLGSLARHVEEALGDGRHELDVAAMKGLLADPDLQAWLANGDALALLPVLR